VVAEFYARIFFRTSVNGGYLVPFESVERIVEAFRTGAEVEVRPVESCLVHCVTGRKFRLKPLGDVAPIVEAGGIFEYARQAGML
jgi:3-isopropylmalate/(R)-2-methylmalate dehydratase small subunit